MKCVVCNNEVEWSKVSEEFSHILDRVDRYGECSLTEREQVVYNGQCCSKDCYNHLQ